MQGKKLVDEFALHLQAEGKAPKTLTSYLGDVQGFISWQEGKGAYFKGHFSNFHISSYKKYLLEAGFEIATINKKINSLQSFNHYLITTQNMDRLVVNLRRDKIKVAAGSEKEVAVLTDAEVEKILFHIQDRAPNRDKLIIYLLLYTGIRVSELVDIKKKDVDLLDMQLTVLGKGCKQREVPLKMEVVEVIQEYLNKERKASKHAHSEFLLLTQRAGKMDRDAVNKILKRMSKELDLSLYPHLFRHTFCTRLLKKGIDLTTVSKLAGHAGIQTTAKFYISTSKKDKQEAVDVL